MSTPNYRVSLRTVSIGFLSNSMCAKPLKTEVVLQRGDSKTILY